MTAFFTHAGNSRLKHLVLFFALVAAYCLWLVAFWPGILGQDSLASILEVETRRDFQSGKPAFWYLYTCLLYGPWRLVEVPIVFQLLFCAFISTRVLGWMLKNAHWKSFIYCLFFVALAPSVVYYSSSLYSDGIYAVALAGMLFEVWRCTVNRRIDRISGIILALTIPFALFSRPNGIINAIALLYLAWLLPNRHRLILTFIALPWCLLAGYAKWAYPDKAPIGSVFPLALYESVGFLENRPMGLWERDEPRVAESTVEALTSTGHSIKDIVKSYDHYYWDPLIFSQRGPHLLSLTQDDKEIIILDFFKYNLWHNFPAFASSRLNIFLYSAFADGDLPGPAYAEHIIASTQSASEFKAYKLPTDSLFLQWLNFSIQHRVLFWTPWLGLLLVGLSVTRALREQRVDLAIIAGVYTAQLAAVFTFSIAGEYRYLLAFFTAPLVLLPMLSYSREDRDV